MFMDIERVVLCTELLKKSSQVEFFIDKNLYEYKNVQETVDKIKKQYGIEVEVRLFDDKFHVIVKVKQWMKKL